MLKRPLEKASVCIRQHSYFVRSSNTLDYYLLKSAIFSSSLFNFLWRFQHSIPTSGYHFITTIFDYRIKILTILSFQAHLRIWREVYFPEEASIWVPEFLDFAQSSKTSDYCHLRSLDARLLTTSLPFKLIL